MTIRPTALKNKHGILQHRICGWVVALFLLCVAGTSSGDDRKKTDVITMDNGDHITGEILSLEFGILELKTSNMGTLSIEWPAVRSIESTYSFYVERTDTRAYFGGLTMSSDAQHLVVTGGIEPVSIPKVEVARLSQIDEGFWRRLDGSFSLGFNFNSSTDISISSLAFNTHFRADTLESSLSLSMNSTKSPESGTSNRDQLSYNLRFLRPRRNFWLALGSLEKNDELGIDGRLQAGAAIGHRFVQSIDTELTGYVGLAVSNEWTTETDPGTDRTQQSLEGVLGSEWRIFRFADPETNLHASLIIYPSLTESGRYRGELNTTLSRELIDDLTFDITLYGSYDNKPPDDNVETSDYGLTTSLSYKF